MTWNQYPLSSLALEFINGGTPSTKVSAYWEGDIPWITGADVEDRTISTVRKHINSTAVSNSSTHIVPKNAVLLVTRTGVGKLVKANCDIAISQDLTGIVLKKSIDPDYAIYAIQSKIKSLARLQQGAIIKGLLRKDIEQLNIPLPPFSEQRRIVEILDQADVLRKKRVEADKVIERIMSALFYKMFGDPLRNEKGWKHSSLGSVSIDGPQYGANSSSIEWKLGLPRYVRITDITDLGTLDPTEKRSLDLTDWQEFELNYGDMLFARSGATVGKSYMYREQDELCAFAGYLIRFKLNRQKVNPWFVSIITRTSYYKNWVASKKRVAAQPNINGQEYASFSFPLPPINLQNEFAVKIEQLDSIVGSVSNVRKHINDLYFVLLHQAFSGNLTAKWREAHMKELLEEMEEQEKELKVK